MLRLDVGHEIVIILTLFFLSTFLCNADTNNYNYHEVDIDIGEQIFVSAEATPSSVDSSSCRIESSSSCILTEPSVLVTVSFSQLNGKQEFSWPDQTDWVILKGKLSLLLSVLKPLPVSICLWLWTRYLIGSSHDRNAIWRKASDRFRSATF